MFAEMAEINICCKLTTIRRRRLSFHLQTRPQRSKLRILQITHDAIHVHCALRSLEWHSAVYVMVRHIRAALKRLGTARFDSVPWNGRGSVRCQLSGSRSRSKRRNTGPKVAELALRSRYSRIVRSPTRADCSKFKQWVVLLAACLCQLTELIVIHLLL